MKRLICLALCLLMVLGSASAQSVSAHSAKENENTVYGASSYLYDTLTLAGSGFEANVSYTVYALESLYDDPALGYQNRYSLMTSGSVFTTSLFTGIRLYELLMSAGLKADLPENTSVKMISKDGYTISFTLGDIKRGYARYSEKGAETPEESDLPMLVAFASNGLPLVGPTGTEPVTKRFKEAEGLDEQKDNVGGPLRLIVGMNSSTEFNAPSCAKWLSAIVVGDANGYQFTRQTVEEDIGTPEMTGDWTHQGAYPEYRLTVKGSEANETVFTLSELEGLRENTVRAYYAASAGRNAYEGVLLSSIVKRCLKNGLEAPTKITVIASDGYQKSLDIKDAMTGVDSMYQPGQHREMLLAYAIDGSPLVPSAEDSAYNGFNSFGPIRLIVENTISAWVKNVATIVLGE